LPDDAPLDPATLNQLLVEIAQKEGASAPQYDLIGYSIGGRIGLALFSDSPAMWKRVALLAPDGLKKSPFYQLTVHTALGRILWFAIDRHAAAVLSWSDRLLKWRIISPHLHGFCSFHLSHHAMRMMVWKGWRAHRMCWPKHREIVRALEDWSGQMDLAFGAHDRIIPPTNGKRLQQLTHQNEKVRFHVLPSGHGMLKPEIVQKLIHRIFPT
jgi:pimeloyl-ACP methyl ester carboxylesterase